MNILVELKISKGIIFKTNNSIKLKSFNESNTYCRLYILIKQYKTYVIPVNKKWFQTKPLFANHVIKYNGSVLI